MRKKSLLLDISRTCEKKILKNKVPQKKKK